MGSERALIIDCRTDGLQIKGRQCLDTQGIILYAMPGEQSSLGWKIEIVSESVKSAAEY